MQYQNENKVCQNCKNDFVIESEDFSFYEKIKVPPPTFCPECRMQRRFAFRNQNNLFKATDAFTGKEIFSLVPDQAKVNIVTNEEWFGDSWDGLDYGKEVNFDRPFLEQVFELHKKTPIVGLNVINMVNSPYAGNANDLKNCYLVFNAGNNSDCMYSTGIHNSNNCVDNLEVYKSENCYECFNVFECNKVFFSKNLIQCADVWFSDDCVGCIDCFGCVGLRNKQYFIFNKAYAREDYINFINNLNLSEYNNFKDIKNSIKNFWIKFPKKYNQGIKNLNCSGTYITKSKNVKNSWLVENGEDLKHVQWIVGPSSKDCYDISVWGYGCELAYEFASCGTSVFNSKFISDCWPNIRNTEYSLHCSSVSDCFGCSGLRNKQYCILNKQYTKEEYLEMIEKIKKHMNEMPYIDSKGLIYKYGEFFPIELSPLGYNITINMEHFPLTKEKVLEYGYNWTEENKGKYEVTKNILDFYEIPISNLNEDIINEVFACTECNSPYKILLNEFLFLKRNNLPIPDFCNICRKKRRIDFRLKPTLYDMKCMCNGVSDITNKFKNTALHDHGENSCPNEFKTGFNPKNSDIVYCEKCYQQEVY